MSVPTDVGAGVPATAEELAPEAAADEAAAAWPMLATAAGAVFVLWGLRIGLRQLHDNSFLTHLATGRIIVDKGVIPRTDPYSFTATGHPWTVASWFASLLYGLTDRVGGLAGIRVLDGVLAAGMAALIWRLARPAGLVARIAITAFAVGLGGGSWLERPLLFGLVAMAIILVLAEGPGDPRWAIPVMWLWVNTHGSFPLGFVAVALMAAGAWLDGERQLRELRLLGWMTVGTLVGGINPLGPSLLLFPLELLHKSHSFRTIQEWNPLRLNTIWAFIFVAQVVVATLLLARRRSWRAALPLAVFTVFAFTSVRNMAPASLVFVPGMAAAVAGLGSIDGLRRSRSAMAGIGGCVIAGCLLGVVSLAQPDAKLDAYPETAVTWLQQQGLLEDHLVAPDYVGNYLEARYGPRRMVFMDDRVDMYPASVVDDAIDLLHGTSDWDAILGRYHAGVVLWERDGKLTKLMRHAPDWRIAYRDKDWVVFLPRA
ncbi:MAG: hypothetical protein JO291_04995 [Acidimicrobiia bacterium]|nr:hypothetical protein [Acidimicrobiia bacterium]